MTDKFYEKQLKKLGTEQALAIDTPIERQSREDAAKRMREVIKITMSHPNGREWVHHWLYNITYAFAPLMRNDTRDFLAGQQSVGLMLFADIMSICPEKFQEMLSEADGRARNTVTSKSEALE